MNSFTQYTSKNHLFNLIDQTDVLLSFVDCNYIYRAVNKTYVTLFNRSYSEIVGHNVEEISGPEVFQSVIKPNLDSAMRGEEVSYEAWFDFTNVKRCYLWVRYHPVYEDSEIIGIVVSGTDITERKQLEEKKALQDKLFMEQSRMAQVGEMVTFIAHQWRRPLHTLATYLLRIRLDLGKADRSIDDELNRSEEILQHLSESLENLHYFHSDQDGVVNVKISVEEVKRLLEPHLNSANILFDIDISKELGIDTRIPSSRLLHLFSVFIENAVEALECADQDNKKIRVNGWENEDAVYVDIRDNGDGVTLEQAHLIFDAGVSTKKKENHGYGLYFARKILLEQLGGSVELIPNGEGAWFRLTFPKL